MDPGSRVNESAPVDVQLRVADSPSVIVETSLMNELIIGSSFTVIVTLSVPVPAGPSTVMV